MLRRKLRRGRYFWRRRGRGRWHGYRRFRRPHRRWRRRGRVSYRRPVYQWVPGRHRYLSVRGWEPLGNVCSSSGAKNEATPYMSIEPQAGGTGVWHGTWGKHYFTLGNLLMRAKALWCMWSDDWASFDYVQFLGGVIKIPQTNTVDWMINFDEYLETKLGTYNPKEHEDKWGHPGILIQQPKTHLIFKPQTYPHKRFYTIRLKPPPGWKGLHRFPEAFQYILGHWIWSWWDPQHAFYDIYGDTSNQNTCQVAPWWATNDKFDKWADRSTYKAPTSPGQPADNNWGPFLPQAFGRQAPQCSLFFLYKLYFKVVGNAIWRPLPRDFLTGGLVPDPKPAPTGSTTGSKATGKKRSRPQSEYDIWPGDLDSDGILKEEALKRITGPGERVKRRKLGEGSVRSIAQKLRHILEQRGLLRK
nr:ORF1 [Torque teno felis virus]